MEQVDWKEFNKRYSQRRLRKEFPIDLHNFPDPDEMSAKIIEIGKRLSTDPEVVGILTRVGLHEQMQWQELYLIDEKIITMWGDERRDLVGWDNFLVAIGLARQLVTRTITASDNEAINAYVWARFCFNGSRLSSGEKMRLSEIYQIYKNFLKRPDLIAPFEEIRARNLPPEQHFFANEEEEDRICDPIIVFVDQQLDIYASKNRTSSRKIGFVSILGAYAKREFDNLAPETVFDRLKYNACYIYNMIDDMTEKNNV